ncbi:MAG TPA: DUF5985 family protein [Polyangia bacterium]|nr:DUF5985 family protein [Polyangia bacterium]
MHQFIWGALTMASWVIATFFLGFWRTTRDRLFGVFSAAFAILGINWLLLGVCNVRTESQHYFYLVRLLAFVLLIGGIVDKNRPSRKG